MITDRPAAWLSWSSGKDSAWALRELRASGTVDVTGLLTTVTTGADRVTMHGVRRELLQAQADAVGLPLHVVEVPWPCTNEDYAERMGAAIAQASSQGVQAMAFGDLFLSEIRAYRESQLAGSGMAPLFPLWGRPTDALAREMVDAGVRAVTVCVDTAQIPQHLVGRPFDADLLAALPDRADPCGENGEFHTFVTDGPEFARPVAVTVGEVTCRDGFCFADLLPAG